MDQITVQQSGKRFIATCKYEQKEIVKAAGFRWDRDARVWFTSDPAVAAKFGSVEAQQQIAFEIEQRATQRAEAVEASRASDADIDIPAPAGLTYMPFQKAGIQFALRVFAALKGGAQPISSSGVLFADEMG